MKLYDFLSQMNRIKRFVPGKKRKKDDFLKDAESRLICHYYVL